MDREIGVVKLTDLTEGKSLFESKGVSIVKVTHNGEVKKLEIPIKSSGISELVDTFRKKAPQPPGKKCKVEAGSEQAISMGIGKTQYVYLSDYTDSDYLDQKEKHDSDLGIKIVLHGLDVPIKDKEGNVVDDDDKKLEIMKGMGITGEQFSQILFTF